MIRGVMTLTALAMMMSSVHADIPKGAPIEVPMPVIAPPPPPKPAPPLPPTPKVRAVPSGSPGSWISSDDYPDVALQYYMEGRSGVRLYIDTAGKVSYCWITESSGFDLLDRAACERLTSQGDFTSARNAKGKPAPDIWETHILWRIPEDEPAPLGESIGIETLVISNLGRVVDCKVKIKDPYQDSSEDQCPSVDSFSPQIALDMRGYGSAPLVEVDLEHSMVMTEVARNQLLKEKPGYETRALLIFRFEVDTMGKMTRCGLEQQRGSEKLVFDNYCYRSAGLPYVPMKNAEGSPVSSSGWVVQRILRKLTP